jgi:hypothetical protein
MKHSLTIVVAGLVVFGAGCNSQEGKITPNANPVTGPEWTLTYSSAGEGADRVAADGFVVTADGKYQYAPGKAYAQSGYLAEADHTLTLSEREEYVGKFTQIQALVRKVEASGVARTCAAGESQDLDKLVLQKRGQSVELFAATGTETCVGIQASDDAKALRDAVRSLAKDYDANAYSADCGQAAAELHALYAPLQGCQTDADCAFVEPFQFVPFTEGYVEAERCDLTRDLVVANASKLDEATRDQLVSAKAKADQACNAYRADCGTWGFETPTQAKPACVANRCRISSNFSR